MTSEKTLGVRAEEHYRQILDTAPDAMVIVGPEGKIVYVNKQTEKLFGYASESLIGQRLDVRGGSTLRLGHAWAVESLS